MPLKHLVINNFKKILIQISLKILKSIKKVNFFPHKKCLKISLNPILLEYPLTFHFNIKTSVSPLFAIFFGDYGILSLFQKNLAKCSCFQTI